MTDINIAEPGSFACRSLKSTLGVRALASTSGSILLNNLLPGLRAVMTGLLMMLGLPCSTAGAEPSSQWADPMMTPAIPTSIGHRALLLDLTRLDGHRPQSHRWVTVGEQGIILYSDDGGRVWQQARVPVQTTLTSVSFVRRTPGADKAPRGANISEDGIASGSALHGGGRQSWLGWAVGHDGVILFSDDDGQTWTRQLDGPSSNQAILDSAQRALDWEESRLHQLKQQINAQGGGGVDAETLMDDQLLAVENAEIALEDAHYDAEQGATRTFLDVLFISHQQGFAVGAYGTLFETQDSGRSWHEVSIRVPNPERLHINRIRQLDADHLLMVGEMGLLLLSGDRGASWRSLDSPYSGSLFNCWVGGGQLIISGLRGQLYRAPLADVLAVADSFKSQEASGHGTESYDDVETSDSEQNGLVWQGIELNTRQTLIAGDYREGNFWLVGNGGQLVQIQDSVVVEYQLPEAHGLTAVRLLESDLLVVGESGVLRLDSQARLIRGEVRSLPYSGREVGAHGQF